MQVSLKRLVERLVEFTYMAVNDQIVSIPEIELKGDQNEVFMSLDRISDIEGYLDFLEGENKEVEVVGDSFFLHDMWGNEHRFHLVKYVDVENLF